MRRTPLATLVLAGASIVALAGNASAGPRVWVVDDAERLRRTDTGSPLARGEGNPIWAPGQPVRLGALREEVVAFQVVVEADDAPLADVAVELDGLALDGERDSTGSHPTPSVERFVEHYVEVRARSDSARHPGTSLGWSLAARPPDSRVLGLVPDALVPVDIAPSWCPYPLIVPARSLGAVWFDVFVPRGARPGRYEGSVVVRDAERELARLPVRLVVADAVLPYRAVSFLAYYAMGNLARTGDAPASERALWQLLHAHHVDALASLNQPDDAARLRPALEGQWFSSASGYVGPGEGRPPLAVALGTYGHFGDPTPAGIANVRAIVPTIGTAVRDVLLYSADEDCDDAAGPAWRRVARQNRDLARLRIAHSCGKDPASQPVDLVLVPADAFAAGDAERARDVGKRVWVYNGALPRAGTLLLDADPTGLLADGWIAASRGIDRWFLWETTFWNDDNSGGRGPIDPFATAESFHNKHGDTALGDGLLVYPGAQVGAFEAHSLGRPDVVIASMRLKELRRGIQDAGYLALARAAHPTRADALADALVPAALDEVGDRDLPTWPAGGGMFTRTRDSLRALVPIAARLDADQARPVLEEGAFARRARRMDHQQARRVGVAAAVLGFVLFAIALRLRARRAHTTPPES